MSTVTDVERDQYLLLMNAPGNAVVYSEKAWAVARKGSYGGPNALWFPDRGAHRDLGGMTAKSLIEWVDDWTLMVPASPDASLEKP